MKERLDAGKVAPELLGAMLELEAKVRASGLEHSLIHLVKIRASQLNGCAYCVHMHVREARKTGETEERLHLLSTWQESPLFTARERAALSWTEALTLVAQTRAPDDVYRELSAELSEVDRVRLTMVIVAINGWNRLAVGFRKVHPVDGAHAAA